MTTINGPRRHRRTLLATCLCSIQIVLWVRVKSLQEITATATAIAIRELNRQAPCSLGDTVTVRLAPNGKRVGFQRLDRPARFKRVVELRA
jgi:hypothetical protein